MKTPARPDERGFSLVELLIGIGIMASVLGVVGAVMLTTSRTYTNNQRIANLQEKGRRAMDRIVRELRGADGSTLNVTTFNSSSKVDYAVGLSYTAPTVTWSGRRQIQCNASSIDANNNGVKTDDYKIVYVNDKAVTETLSEYVKSGGFTATLSGNNLKLTLTLVSVDTGGKTVQATVTSSVCVRNQSL